MVVVVVILRRGERRRDVLSGGTRESRVRDILMEQIPKDSIFPARCE